MDSGLLPVEHTGAETRSRSTNRVDRRTSRRPVDVTVQVQQQAQAKKQKHKQTRKPAPESPAVVVAGSTAGAKTAVLGELLGSGTPVIEVPAVPDETYLVLRHGSRPAARAFLPGSTRSQPYPAKPVPRPPRRVEASMPVPMLASFELVAAPAADAFGPAYDRILLDAAARGGALLFILDAAVLPGEAELEFLVGAGKAPTTVFFAFWAGDAARWAADAARGSDLHTRMAAYRDVVASRVPRFEQAPWFLVTPQGAPGPGVADLRQALLDWSAGTPAADGVRRRVTTAADGHESGWEELLGRLVTAAQYGVRQAVTTELDTIHARCADDLTSDGSRSRMPAALDREMHALSLRCVDEVDAAVAGIVRRVFDHVLAEAPHDDVLRRVAGALRRGIEEDAPDLARVLLVTSTSGAVAAVSGTTAAGALSAYQTRAAQGVLPPLGVGLSASCYRKWRDPGAGVDAARDWLEEAIRGVELALQRALTERFEAVQQVLNGLVADTVDHGLLLV